MIYAMLYRLLNEFIKIRNFFNPIHVPSPGTVTCYFFLELTKSSLKTLLFELLLLQVKSQLTQPIRLYRKCYWKKCIFWKMLCFMWQVYIILHNPINNWISSIKHFVTRNYYCTIVSSNLELLYTYVYKIIRRLDN